MTNWQAESSRPVSSRREVEDRVRFNNVPSPTNRMRDQLKAAKKAAAGLLDQFDGPVNVLAAGHVPRRDDAPNEPTAMHLHLAEAPPDESA